MSDGMVKINGRIYRWENIFARMLVRMHVTKTDDASPQAKFSPEARRLAYVIALRFIQPFIYELKESDDWKAAERAGTTDKLYAERLLAMPWSPSNVSDRLPAQGLLQAMAFVVPLLLAVLGTFFLLPRVAEHHQMMAAVALGIVSLMLSYVIITTINKDRADQLLNATANDNGLYALTQRFAAEVKNLRLDPTTRVPFDITEHPGRVGEKLTATTTRPVVYLALYKYNRNLLSTLLREQDPQFKVMFDQVASEIKAEHEALAAKAAKDSQLRKRARSGAVAGATVMAGGYAVAAYDDESYGYVPNNLAQYPTGFTTNTANGMPMIEGSMFDVGGHAFGTND